MYTKADVPFAAFMGALVGALIVCAVVLITGTTYEQGQIDAVTGKMKLELRTLPDSTRVWQKTTPYDYFARYHQK